MSSETIVAVFSSMSQAEAAISDLVGAGVSASSIKHYARDQTKLETVTSEGGTPAHHHHGFWAWLTGSETTHEAHDVYNRSIESGHTVVTVVIDATQADHIYATLERHDPLDIDDHGTSSSVGHATDPMTAVAAPPGFAPADFAPPAFAPPDFAPPAFARRTASDLDTTRTSDTEQVLPLSEETLQVGKREVARGSTRIRRYTVERPVEEQIRLRDETVTVFRRPVSNSETVGADAFHDHEIVVTETDEEAVVTKTARVVEEVVVQKGVTERVETIHETVRREEVEIDKIA